MNRWWSSAALLLFLTCTQAVTVIRRHDVDPLVEEDPKTHKRDMNHHMLLHQPGDGKVVDGAIISNISFSTELMEHICNGSKVVCIEGLPIAVVRCPLGQMTEIMTNYLKELKYIEFKAHLPAVVNFMRHHMEKDGVQAFIHSYKSAGVPLPEEDIKLEFRRENVDLPARPASPARTASLREVEIDDDVHLVDHSSFTDEETEDEDNLDEEEPKPNHMDDEMENLIEVADDANPAEMDDEADDTNPEDMGDETGNLIEEESLGSSYQPGDRLREEDPKTGEASINHHYLLHQVNEESPVDGVLFMKKGEAFTTEDLHAICKEFVAQVECLEDNLPIVVVRAAKKNMDRILDQVGDVDFADLKENLPDIVNYLKNHIGIKDVNVLLEKYKNAGVKIPAGAIAEEFEKEHVDLQ